MELLFELLSQNKFIQLKNELVRQNEVDIAEFLEELEQDKMLLVFRILPKNICADVFSYMTTEQQQHIIESVSDTEIRQLIDDLFLDDAVDFLEEVPAGVVKKVLENVDENTRALINVFLNYAPNSAGSIMTVEYVELKDNLTVKEAIDVIRKTVLDKETIYTTYIINNERKLIGTLTLSKLLSAADSSLVKDIMDARIICVQTSDDQEAVADSIRKYDLISLPVVDNEKRLVGIVTVDDAMDVIEDENTEDFEIMAAMNPSETPYLKTGIWQMSRNRIVWLLVLMISATVTGLIIARFEAILSSVMILTTFIPMLTDTGGNAGSQSSTLVIRGLSLGELETGDFLKVAWKEFRVSLICGVILASVNFLRLVFISGVDVTISAAVCLSVVIVVICAKIIGGLLPLGAKRLNIDPAIMASPLITTIVDALALIIYFSISTSLLSL